MAWTICAGCPFDLRLASADTSRVPRIAAVAAPFDRDVERGLARVALYAQRAREQGPEVLVLPESALGGYLREPGPDESAPDVPDGLHLGGPEIAQRIAIAG